MAETQTQEKNAFLYFLKSSLGVDSLNYVLGHNTAHRQLQRRLNQQNQNIKVPEKLEPVIYHDWPNNPEVSFVEIPGSKLSLLFSTPNIVRDKQGSFDPTSILALCYTRMDLVGWTSANEEGREIYRADIYNSGDPQHRIAFASPYHPEKRSKFEERMASREIQRVQWEEYQMGQPLEDAINACFNLFSRLRRGSDLNDWYPLADPVVVVTPRTLRFHESYKK